MRQGLIELDSKFGANATELTTLESDLANFDEAIGALQEKVETLRKW